LEFYNLEYCYLVRQLNSMEKQTGLLEGEVFCPDAIFCSVLSLIENHCLLLLKSVSIHQLLDILYVVCRIDSVREENNNNSSNGVPLESH
jgi:hypothetical protein